ncbi:MAG TPA: sigma-70 family RNA polymerase sigma factor [Acidimicrobiales bacterium]|nr:sigma-70 family RNA polymerase sigma factor [Acidimicrobiales bacterium]
MSAYGAIDREETTLEADAFCRGLYPKLVGSLRLAFGAQVPAEDLAQDALVRTIERWDAVAAMDHPEAWCYRVAFNLARSGFRRRQAEARATARLGARRPHDDDPPEPDDVLAVRAALAHLPRRQRQAIVLRYYADLSVDQVAETMKCRPGTVKAHLHQGLMALRHAGLTDDGLASEDLPGPDRPDVGPTVQLARGSAEVASDVEQPAHVRRPQTTAPPIEQQGVSDA